VSLVTTTDDWAISAEDFDPLQRRYRFTVDAAASAHNARLPNYWTAADDALSMSWAGERVWCNPPYSRPLLELFICQAWAEHCAPGGPDLIVMLVPANRTDQPWWQALVEPYRDAGRMTTRFLAGRLRWIRAGTDPGGHPTFGCCLLIWGGAGHGA
jgi:phage N-6-adenine-methyltransferase